MITSKSQLARELSKVKGFVNPKLELRQYLTPPDIAAELLWTAFMNRDLIGREVFDLGCGTGVLLIGAKMLGASEVIGFDVDSDAINEAISNAQSLKVEVLVFQQDVKSIKQDCDTVLMNPPFMVKGGVNDRVFLEKAFQIADSVYSINNADTRAWVKKFALSYGFAPELISTRDFLLPHSYQHHVKIKGSQRVDLWRFTRNP